MPYTIIDLSNVFIYKALPDSMKDRVLRLPAHIETLLAPTGFPKVDSRLQQASIQSVNWSEFPQQNLTHCSFLDAFTALVHRHGLRPLYFYAQKMNVSSVPDLNATVKTLSGITAKYFITQYTLKMVHDLQYRTNLNQKEIGEVLQFSSRYSILQFLKMYGKQR